MEVLADRRRGGRLRRGRTGHARADLRRLSRRRPEAVPDTARVPCAGVAAARRGRVSLPDFAETPRWFDEADCEYFSAAHWFPLVNGRYGRAALKTLRV